MATAETQIAKKKIIHELKYRREICEDAVEIAREQGFSSVDAHRASAEAFQQAIKLVERYL